MFIIIKREKIHQLCGFSKIREIVRQWHGLEMFWSDFNGDIRVENGVFFEPSREKLLLEELKEKMAKLKNSHQLINVLDSKVFNGKILALKLFDESEYLGIIWGYPVYEQKILCDTEYLLELMNWAKNEIAQYCRDMAKKNECIHVLNEESDNIYHYHTMIGKSSKMQEIYGLLRKVSGSESNVFIQGANGTGKELVAKAIHYNSPRKNNIFLAVNCAAFNENLLDSELFGHKKGAFTGAVGEKKGLFEQADGGTLFLDEVGDTSLSMQVKLLRVIQEGAYFPVGASSPKKCNVRIIASTNQSYRENDD